LWYENDWVKKKGPVKTEGKTSLTYSEVSGERDFKDVPATEETSFKAPNQLRHTDSWEARFH